MKNLWSKTVKNINLIKNDFAFHNNYTELLAIWTIIFMTITGLFVMAIKSTIPVMFLFFVFAVAIMFVGILIATKYLYVLRRCDEKKLVSRIHNRLNNSFKLRSLFRFLKIPHITFVSNLAKNLRFTS
jgi:hypothetical protein